MKRTYNERYSRTVPVRLGDLEQMLMALGVADDYLMWLVELRDVRKGAYNSVRGAVADARAVALELYGEST